MSAIVEAMVVARDGYDREADPGRSGERLAEMMIAGDRVTAASQAAASGNVIAGAPRTWAVRWRYSAWRGWFAAGDRSIVSVCGAFPPDREQRMRPCWDSAARVWRWGSPACDPRGCAWPRPWVGGEVRRG